MSASATSLARSNFVIQSRSKDQQVLAFDDILTTSTILKEAVHVLAQGKPEYIEVFDVI